jgi:hypothetical protein
MPGREPSTERSTKRPFQFQLSHLMSLTVACAFLLALYFYWGVIGFVAMYLVALAILIWGAVMVSNRWSAIGYVLLFAGLAGSCLMPAHFDVPRTRSPSGRCGDHLKLLAVALQNYHDVYDTFPPAYIADSSGKPMHSWRVLILPFAEQKDLYDAYNFNEPWDGPNNSKLHSLRPPAYFGCPSSHKQQPTGETNYVAIVGPQTMWPGEKATKLADFADGMSNTIMVVEVTDSGIHWMEPRDLHVVQMPMAVNPAKGTGISSAHPDGAQAVFADGRTEYLPNGLPSESLLGLLTIAGGEPPLPDLHDPIQ